MLKKLFLGLLDFLSRFYLKKNKPYIIAITGSVGKTGTKDFLYEILKRDVCFKKHDEHLLNPDCNGIVRCSPKSFNSESGVNFSILNIKHNIKSVLFLFDFVKAIAKLFFADNIKYLILEIGVDKKGDMDKMLKIFRPDVCILTDFSDPPSHSGNFGSKEEVYEEKLKLASAAKDLIIFNKDSRHQAELLKDLNVEKIGFSINAESDFRGEHIALHTENAVISGLDFSVVINSKSESFYIDKKIGNGAVMNVLSAIALACYLKIDVNTIRVAIASSQPIKGRMKLLDMNDFTIIDDTYNSSPASVINAVKSMGTIKTEADRIVILSPIKELGRYEKEGWESILEVIPKYASEIILYRPTPVIKEILRGYDLSERIKIYTEKEDIARDLHERKLGKIILIKGSRFFKMEDLIFLLK